MWGENFNKFLFRSLLLYIAVKKYENWSIFARVITKINASRFYGPRCRYCTYLLTYLRKTDRLTPVADQCNRCFINTTMTWYNYDDGQQIRPGLVWSDLDGQNGMDGWAETGDRADVTELTALSHAWRMCCQLELEFSPEKMKTRNKFRTFPRFY